MKHSDEEFTCQCRRHKRFSFNPWARKIPWRTAWQLTPKLLPGKSHGQKTLEGCSSWGCKESDKSEHIVHTYSVKRAQDNLSAHSEYFVARHR